MIILNTKLHDLGVFYQNLYFIFVDFFLFTRNFIKNSYTNSDCLTLKKIEFPKQKKRVPKFFYPFLRKGKKVFGSTKCKFCMYKDTSCNTRYRIKKFYLDYSILD